MTRSPDQDPGVLDETRQKTRIPTRYKVILLNDDYSTMEFVVQILETVFHKSPAEAYRLIFFLMNFNNDYVHSLPRDLAKQCPSGRVEGVLTKHEDITYFPLIAHATRVTATGYCQTGAAQ